MNTMPRFRIARKEHQPFDGFNPVHCSHCGRQIEHLYELTDTETNAVLYPIGSACAFKITGHTVSALKVEWDEYQAQQAKDEEMEVKAKASREWQIVNADVLAGLEVLANGEEHFIPNAESMLENVQKWGTLTEKQMDYAKRMIENTSRYCGKTEYYETVHLAIFLECELRLGRFDAQFLNDFVSRDQFGVTIKQVEAVKKIAFKYRRQISEKSEEAKRWHIEMATT